MLRGNGEVESGAPEEEEEVRSPDTLRLIINPVRRDFYTSVARRRWRWS